VTKAWKLSARPGFVREGNCDEGAGKVFSYVEYIGHYEAKERRCNDKGSSRGAARSMNKGTYSRRLRSLRAKAEKALMDGMFNLSEAYWESSLRLFDPATDSPAWALAFAASGPPSTPMTICS
jgi:hypothetical protein